MPSKNIPNAAFEIDNEIQSVYEYCLAAGLTHEEIVAKARPLLHHPFQFHEWRKTLLTIVKIAICCLALSYTLASDTISRSVFSHGRHFMFKVLSIWDWTDLYTEACLLENPYYSYEKVVIVDCRTCKNVFDVDYLNRTSADEIHQSYVQKNLPVIIRDATSDWPIMKESFSIVNLTEGFQNLKEDVCTFRTNLRVENHQEVFEQLLDQNVQKWYAHWENCEKSTQKLMRKFYSRPYFIPSAVQMTESNWIIMSSGYYGKKFKKLDVLQSISAMWIAQIWGYNRIQFQPKEPCNDICNELEDTIEEGEIVLFNPSMWDFSYLPGAGTENLAIGVGGFSHFAS